MSVSHVESNRATEKQTDRQRHAQRDRDGQRQRPCVGRVCWTLLTT